MTALPIDSVLPELKKQLHDHRSAVLIAEPGAGKTTRVPLALLDSPWLAGGRIVMLEPRRLAARSAAAYMAASIGEEVGRTVGYRVRMDSRVGPATRIEVITEGVLTRMLQSDPALDGVGLVIFDEFHERNLHADIGLALCLQSRALFRDDMRIVVMSATMDASPVADMLGDARIIRSEGRNYPVQTRYSDRRPEGGMEQNTARAVMRALAEETGDLLVFLPGAGEIRRTASLLAGQLTDDSVQVLPLHGNLPQDAQDRAIAPAIAGTRKVVLATSIAETSLTIQGTRVVVDSGWMRVPKFSPNTGMSRLETVRVSIASADQRRGRAGRLGPGVCYRLWTQQEESRFEAHGIPELKQADLASLALELAVWGTADPHELQWLDAPPAGAYRQARELLASFDALDTNGAITDHGRHMAEIGLHPRLAHMVIRSIPLGLGETACLLAGLLNERDIFRKGASVPAPAAADLRWRLDAIIQASGGTRMQHGQLEESALKRVLADAENWKRSLRIRSGGKIASEACGQLLALAYPDRIAQGRGDGRFLLSNGRGAAFAENQFMSGEAYLVAAELDDHGQDSRILLAAPLELKELENACAERISEETIVEWEPSAQAVRARRRKRLGAIVLSDSPLQQTDAEATVQALLHGIGMEGIGILPWTNAARRMQERVLFMRRYVPDWPDLSDEALSGTLEDWLAPHIHGMRSRNDLQKLNLASVLESALTWDQKRRLDDEAPTHITVPSGSRIPVDYGDPSAPALYVRLQELFGMTETPAIAGGRVPITMHLLSPAQRPVQVTRDLASFWRETYFEVKKDLKGRYPKHYWPDDPLSAIPTNRAKPRA
ncbi:ATP-dependent helicase HrpB [Paenibacillus mesophilus]|uniref:ATP-dependent helicase HrpB n=1 Tax=Paenibacillus mesophilus TaxID=2582849 RepID=UPI00110E9691|nr:ATP-dependent helicase HrpB [Paenibacillus mesophilus]TMV50186.1 ATP-dependent helicase HrpB [Paenibacillus mesophilus]